MTKLLQIGVFCWCSMICALKIKITKMLQCQADCNNNRARVYKAFFIEATNLINIYYI